MEKYIINISGFDLIQEKGLQSTTLDSLLISDFVRINLKSKNILDIGSGFGIISMILARKSKANVLGVEINKKAYEISKINKENYNLENLKFLNFDILEYKNLIEEQSFDIVVSNPPYFKENIESQMKKSNDLITARNEKNLSIKDIILISNKILKDKGSLYLIFRSERLMEVFSYLNNTKLVIKRLKPVYTKFNDDKALISMIELVKNAKEGLIIEKPIYIYNENGEKNEYIRELYGR